MTVNQQSDNQEPAMTDHPDETRPVDPSPTTEVPARDVPATEAATTEALGTEAPGPRRRGPSVPTIVLGLLFGLVATIVMVGQNSDVDLNLAVTAPLTLLAAGIVLVGWGVAGLGRARRTG